MFHPVRGKLIAFVGKQKIEIPLEPSKKGHSSPVEWKWDVLYSHPKTRHQVSIFSSHPILLEKIEFSIPMDFEPSHRVFLHGYQSWTESREFSLEEKIPPPFFLARPIAFPYGDYSFVSYPHRRGYLHSHAFTYLRKGDLCYFGGSLDERSGYTIFRYRKDEKICTIEKDCAGVEIEGAYKILDLLVLEGDLKKIMEHYFQEMGHSPKPQKTTAGWTSWYRYFTGISEEIILENLRGFQEKKIPLEIFQIDDGYQKAVGDWMNTNEKFPRGMKPLADRIHQAGYQAGLWLAPFICEKKSFIYKKHPSWLLRDKRGKAVRAGYNPLWGGVLQGSFYALDWQNSEVQGYLKKVFETVGSWGFDLVKLDFLYAAALLPQRRATRGELMARAMDFLQEIWKDKKILGCGVPLPSAWGKVEYCRIGSDVHTQWDVPILKWMGIRERLSTFNSLRSTLGRWHLGRYGFYQDPDVFILRSLHQKMSFSQRGTLFLVNALLGGLLFTSDHLLEYDSMELEIYHSLFPVVSPEIQSVEGEGFLYRISFQLDGRKYLALVNLGPSPALPKVEEKLYFQSGVGKFWKGREYPLPPFSSACLMELPPSDFAFAGSTMHLFPGAEIQEIHREKEKLEILFHPQSQKKGLFYFQLEKEAPGLVFRGEKGAIESIEGQRIQKFSI